jgi:hypothetical protein
MLLHRAQSAALSSHVSASPHAKSRFEVTPRQDVPEPNASPAYSLSSHSWKNKTQNFHPFRGVSTDKMTIGRGPRFGRYGVLGS